MKEITIKQGEKEYTLKVPSPYNPENIWISMQDGEGSEFKAEMFFELIDKFYQDNF